MINTTEERKLRERFWSEVGGLGDSRDEEGNFQRGMEKLRVIAGSPREPTWRIDDVRSLIKYSSAGDEIYGLKTFHEEGDKDMTLAQLEIFTPQDIREFNLIKSPAEEDVKATIEILSERSKSYYSATLSVLAIEELRRQELRGILRRGIRYFDIGFGSDGLISADQNLWENRSITRYSPDLKIYKMHNELFAKTQNWKAEEEVKDLLKRL